MDLQCNTSRVGDRLVIALGGVADLSTAPLLHGQLTDAATAHPGQCLVIDLDGLTILDDVALGLLLGAAAKTRELGGELTLVCATGRMRDRLAATRLDRVVAVRDSIG